MDTTDALPASTRSAWFWLLLGVGMGVLFAVQAARTGVVGFAICGVGSTILGAAWYLNPMSLRAPIRQYFRSQVKPSYEFTVLNRIGFVLVLAGSVLRWIA